MYFRSLEHLHKFAHGKTHRAGWSWWDEMTKQGRVSELSISHEVYVVPKGGFENIYVNAEVYDFGEWQVCIWDELGMGALIFSSCYSTCD